MVPVERPSGQLAGAELEASWLASWELLGTASPAGALKAVLDAWGEPYRHYHDLRHLRDCMALWTEWQEHCRRPGEVGIALWYHDVVYLPRLGDNEAQSATWVARDLRAAGVAEDSIRRVHDLVMATRHHSPPDALDAQVLVDIDLAVLGAAPDRFEQSNQDIRKEYDWVPEETYRMRRAEVLSRFAARASIFSTPAAVARFEAQARENLAFALRKLRW